MASKSPYGARIKRREDVGLVTGETKYTDDFMDPRAAHAAILRSQHGHARLTDIDSSRAEVLEGVIAVFTGEDIEASGVTGEKEVAAGPLPNQKGTFFPLLAYPRAIYAGEPIAVVIAEDKYTAHQAKDLIEVEYVRLPAMMDVDAALEDDAPVLHDEYSDNLGFDWEFGDHEEVAAAFEDADHAVDLEFSHPPLIPNAMESRSVLVEFDPGSERLTARMSSQVPHRAREYFSEPLDLDVEQVRVRAPAIGGGYGSKNGTPYPEEALIGWCAMQVDRPVKWKATRSESNQADHQGRGVQSHGELAFDDDGTIRALRVNAKLNLGAYLGWQITPAFNFHDQISSVYDIPLIAGHFIGAYTNRPPIGPFRGAGTPAGIILVARLIDEAAAELGLDPAEIRRRNLIPADAFPFETAVGTVYDSGDYETALDKAIELSSYEELRERQRALREEGRYLGVGIGAFTKKTGVTKKTDFWIGTGKETNRVFLDEDGTWHAYVGTTDHGQGHQTTFSQMLAGELGVPMDTIEVHEGDSDALPSGQGTFGCRSTPVSGGALVKAAEKIREQARRLVADEFEAAPEDIQFEDGEFYIAGAPESSIHITEIASWTYEIADLPEGIEAGLESSATFEPDFTHSFGVHVAVVEVDLETGAVDLQEYFAVDDVGTQINPMIVDGQIIGGIGQGTGEALLEEAIWDENGTLLTASFTDYALPRAHDVPEITLDRTETPCPHNPTGAKGAGENGVIGSPPTIINAVVDALRPLGVNHLEHPLTAETVWQGIQSAQES